MSNIVAFTGGGFYSQQNDAAMNERWVRRALAAGVAPPIERADRVMTEIRERIFSLKGAHEVRPLLLWLADCWHPMLPPEPSQYIFVLRYMIASHADSCAIFKDATGINLRAELIIELCKQTAQRFGVGIRERLLEFAGQHGPTDVSRFAP